MPTTEMHLDIDRALDGAASDVGEALQLRRRAVSDANLRRGLKQAVAGGVADPEQLDAASCGRRATALFILGQDADVARFARRSDNHRVLYLAGLAEIYRDRPIAAETSLRASVDREPRDEQARLQLASIQALLGRTEDARETLAPLADQEDRPQVLYVLGAIAEAEGRYGESQKLYEGALSHDPDHVDSLFRLAYQHDLSGDDNAAIALYERARRVKPTRLNILLNLGVLYEDVGGFDKAAECYRGVLAQEPNHPRAKAFLRDAESSLFMVVDDDMERNEDRRNQLLSTPISDFELSVRSRNCLAKMSILSLGDLIQRTEADLLSYKNFGETSLQEIKDILGAKSLRLGMRRDEVLAPPVDPAAPAAAAATEMPDVPPDAPEHAAVLSTPISDLDFSVRSSKCMALLAIQVVGDLVEYSENDLLKTKNFGVTSLHEIKSKLGDLGLGLKKS